MYIYIIPYEPTYNNVGFVIIILMKKLRDLCKSFYTLAEITKKNMYNAYLYPQSPIILPGVPVDQRFCRIYENPCIVNVFLLSSFAHFGVFNIYPFDFTG